MRGTNNAACAQNHDGPQRLREWGRCSLCCLAIALLVACHLRVRLIFLLHGRSLYNWMSKRPYYVRAPCSLYQRDRGSFGSTAVRPLLPEARAESDLLLPLSLPARVLSFTLSI